MTSQGNKPAHSRTEVSFAQVVHETIPNRSSSQLDDQLESDDGYLEQDDEENDRIQMQAGNVDDIIVPDRISQLISRKGADVAMKRKGNRRESMVRDLETGKMGGARAQSAELRSKHARHAQSGAHRLLQNLQSCFGGNGDDVKNEEKDDEQISKSGRYMVSSRHLPVGEFAQSQNSERQYCLKAVPPPSQRPKWIRWLGFGSSSVSIFDSPDSTSFSKKNACGVKPSDLVVSFLHWTFRKNLSVVLFVLTISWFVFSFLFALVIWLVGLRNPQCIGGPEAFGNFFDAFLLSWTTLSTVGYGCIFVGAGVPNLGEHDVLKCAPINGIVSLESFFGVLFASFITAIMFVKVARVQMSAKVEFSMPICIRYGSGVAIEMECTNNESKNESIDEADNGSNCSEEEDVPCPLLEFRVANLMNNVYGGEIIDAKMNVVAAIDATSHAPKILSSVFRPHRETIVVDSSAGPNPTSSLAMDDNQVFHEDACGYLVPKTSYIKLECQTHEHPFFKRVFLMRHKLDHNSPLLEPSIRDLVQSRNGAWPSELCNASAIRQSLRFNQLLVSLRGISNADARDVYAQKVYDFADVVVGYRFVNMMYRDQWGTLQTDMKLINDVVHQAGGGGENIFPGKSDLKRDVLFL